MEASENFFQIFRSLVQQLPSLLAMLGCIVAAIVLWKRQPKVSLTVIIAMVFLVIHVFVFAVVYAVLPYLVMRSTGGYERIQTVYNLISFLYNSSLAVGLGALLIAVFMRRTDTVTTGGS
jgi:hypothetical protein